MKTDDEGLLASTSERVIGAVIEVSNTLGAGFLEKLYERALLRELAIRGIRAEGQVSFSVSYKGQRVGDYCADIVVEDELVVELKCVERLGKEHTAQCLNYLRVSGLRVCLLVNFQRPRAEWQRIFRPRRWEEDREGIDLATDKTDENGSEQLMGGGG